MIRWEVIVCLAVTVVSSSLARIGSTSSQNRLPYTPVNVAFSIWGLIFPSLAAFAIRQNWSASSIPLLSNIFLCVSLILSAVWAPVFSRGDPPSLIASSVLLFFSAIFSLASVLLSSDAIDKKRWMDVAFLEAPVQLYTGWLFLASTLGVGIALNAYYSLPDSVLLVPTLLASGIGIWKSSPFILFPVLWGLSFVPSKTPVVQSCITLTTVSVVLSLFNR